MRRSRFTQCLFVLNYKCNRMRIANSSVDSFQKIRYDYDEVAISSNCCTVIGVHTLFAKTKAT